MTWIPHNRVLAPQHGADYVTAAVQAGHWAQGPVVQRLEESLKTLVQREHAVCVASGTSALRLGLQALGVGDGDEVIIPAYACVALANAVLSLNAVPVPVDCEGTTWTIDPKKVSPTPKTKAIIAVHIFGAQANINALLEFGLPVIEDCAHALGAQPFGMTGTLAIGSFYATKLIGAGEGGVVLTNDTTIADAVKRERDYTDRPAGGHRLNDKMTDMAAALCLAQLEALPEQLAQRKRLAQRYDDLLNPLFIERHISLPQTGINTDRLWYRYPILLHHIRAQVLEQNMERHGVGVAEPVWDWLSPSGHAIPPTTQKAYSHILSLPLYPSLSETEQDTVVAALTRCLTEE